MPDIDNTTPAAATNAPVPTNAATSAGAAVTPTPATTPATPVVPVAPSGVTTEGKSNGLPPAAPGVQLDPPDEVKALREWFHHWVNDSVHSQDTPHYNVLHELVQSLCAKLHSKYPLAKET